MRSLSFILLAVVILASVCQAGVPQCCTPEMPGYINWNKTTFAVGDTVMVLNANGMEHDSNGYMLPHLISRCNPIKGVIIYADTSGEAPYYRCKVNLSGVETEFIAMFAIPQQNIVGWKL